MIEEFDATLTPSQRHLARRLESFGDVVFGFTISQLVLQFPLPVAPADLLAHRERYLVYFFTFAIIALLWLSYHRTISNAFAPHPLDIALTFAFLAFTGLTPYAMYAYLHYIASADGARYGLGAYIVCGIGTLLTSTLLQARNYPRGAPFLDEIQRLHTYRRLLVTAIIVGVFVLELALDIGLGAVPTLSFFVLIPLAPLIVRRLVRAAPPLRSPEGQARNR